MAVTASALGNAAEAMATAGRNISRVAATLATRADDLAPAAEASQSAGRTMVHQLGLLDGLASPGSEMAGVRDAVQSAAEVLLVRSGQLRAGAAAGAADDLARAARTADEAARSLGMEAYFARAREGVGRAPGAAAADGKAAAGILVDDLHPPTSAAEQAAELAELHRRAAARTPEETVRAITVGKVGNGIAWDEYARLYEAEFGVEEATRLRQVLGAAIDETVEVSERLKNQLPRTRPFVADPTLTTVVNRPQTLSFPSGHTARAEAGAAVLEAFWPQRAREFRHLADQVGEARLYGGVHYPSDIAAGRTLGRRAAEKVLRDAGAAAAA